MNIRKIIISICLIVTNLSLFSMPAHAQTFTKDGSATIPLNSYIEDPIVKPIAATYDVSITAILQLDWTEHENDYAGTYKVGVKGAMSPDAVLKVAPVSNKFTMKGEKTGKTVTASVTQEKTSWKGTEIDSTKYSYSKGKVKASFPKVDQYEGSVSFKFELKDK